MSGLFGIIDLSDQSDVEQFLNTASQHMSHFDWHRCDTWIKKDGSLGLGRLGIGIFNPEPQPVKSGDQSLTLFMCGELYDRTALRHRLRASDTLSDSELALAAYEQYGILFAAELNGAFFIAVYDQRQQRLVLANDRFGLYPHYLYIQPGKLVFAPEVKGVLRAGFVETDLNLTAVAEFLRFQHLLGEKTFWTDIRLFPYGSVGQFDLAKQTWTLDHYWNWGQIPHRPDARFDEAIDEAGTLLRQAVERRTADSLQPGVFLSGGLDSRTLLGLIPPRDPPPVTATFGAFDSRDVYYAQRIAQRMNARHFWFDLPDGQWVADHVALHLQLTDGFQSWLHMHGITMLPRLREMMDFNLTGWDGGTVMGHADHINPIYNHPIDFETILVENYQQFTRAYTWPGLTDAEERLLFAPAYAKQMVGLAFDSMRQELLPFWDFRREYAAEYFYIANHCWRLTQHMITVTRAYLEVRFPFWDYALIDYMYSLPPALRRDQLLYRHIITGQTPKLATIPRDSDELWPTTRPLLRDTQSLVLRGSRKLGLHRYRPTLYADYENYLRGDLRAWAEAILFDKRVSQRGLYDMAFVRSLMKRHVAGHEPWTIGKVASLISLELLLREYFD